MKEPSYHLFKSEMEQNHRERGGKVFKEKTQDSRHHLRSVTVKSCDLGEVT